ncbi:MAG: hypothetical protein PVH29_09270 [Candidatus Zixiibacteriota bacterium]|jgi:hypothetical protein
MKKLLGLALALVPAVGYAAVGCTLNDPDRDVRRLFPSYTSYKTEFNTIEEHGGAALRKEVEGKLGDKLDPEYESLDVPYACYTVFEDKKVIGYVFGVNQKGLYGGMQVIIAADTKGVIRSWYYQKLSHPEAGALRAESFRKQFFGLSLADFYRLRESFDAGATGRGIAGFENPLTDGQVDFRNTLRGMMKALILFDVFKLDRMHG